MCERKSLMLKEVINYFESKFETMLAGLYELAPVYLTVQSEYTPDRY